MDPKINASSIIIFSTKRARPYEGKNKPHQMQITDNCLTVCSSLRMTFYIKRSRCGSSVLVEEEEEEEEVEEE